MATSRQLVLPAPGSKFTVEETSIPDPPPGGAVVKVHFAGICHSDVGMWQDDTGYNIFPAILGHEISGVVHSLGSPKQEDACPSLRVGDRVAVYVYQGCGGDCPACLHDRADRCAHLFSAKDPNKSGILSINREGGYQDYLVVNDQRNLVVIPESIPLDVGSILTCSGITAYNAISEAEGVIQGAKELGVVPVVMIVGLGSLGTWAYHLLRAMYPEGLRLVAMDIKEEKMQLAQELGFDDTVLLDANDSSEVMTQKIKDIISEPVTAVLDFVATTQTVGACLPILQQWSTLVLVGFHIGPQTTLPPVPMDVIILHQIHLVGVRSGTRAQLRELMDLVHTKKVKPPGIVHVGLGEVQGVLEQMKEGKPLLKHIIDFN